MGILNVGQCLHFYKKNTLVDTTVELIGESSRQFYLVKKKARFVLLSFLGGSKSMTFMIK